MNISYQMVSEPSVLGIDGQNTIGVAQPFFNWNSWRIEEENRQRKIQTQNEEIMKQIRSRYGAREVEDEAPPLAYYSIDPGIQVVKQNVYEHHRQYTHDLSLPCFGEQTMTDGFNHGGSSTVPNQWQIFSPPPYSPDFFTPNSMASRYEATLKKEMEVPKQWWISSQPQYSPARTSLSSLNISAEKNMPTSHKIDPGINHLMNHFVSDRDQSLPRVGEQTVSYGFSYGGSGKSDKRLSVSENAQKLFDEMEKEEEEIEIKKNAEPRVDGIEKEEIETVKTVKEDTEVVNNEETPVHEYKSFEGDNHQGKNAEPVEATRNLDDVEQKYHSLSQDFLSLESQNSKLQSDLNDSLAELAESQAQEHKLHLQSIEKDRELEKMTTEMSELHISKRQLMDLLEQKDVDISEKNSTIKSYLDKTMKLTKTSSEKEARLDEANAELAHSQAMYSRLSQEKNSIAVKFHYVEDTMKHLKQQLDDSERYKLEYQKQLSKVCDERELIKNGFDLQREEMNQLKECVFWLEEKEFDLEVVIGKLKSENDKLKKEKKMREELIEVVENEKIGLEKTIEEEKIEELGFLRKSLEECNVRNNSKTSQLMELLELLTKTQVDIDSQGKHISQMVTDLKRYRAAVNAKKERLGRTEYGRRELKVELERQMKALTLVDIIHVMGDKSTSGKTVKNASVSIVRVSDELLQNERDMLHRVWKKKCSIYEGINQIWDPGGGKGRDVAINQMYLFEAKVACGNEGAKYRSIGCHGFVLKHEKFAEDTRP